MKSALFPKRALVLAALLAGCGAGCSLKQMAVDRVADTLAGAGGAGVFASDDDPELVEAAVPFGLKLMEALLAESPEHRGLLEALAAGFTQYAYGFVLPEADELEETDFEAAEAVRARARRLLRRARDYGLRGLDAAHPGFTRALRRDPQAAVTMTRREDVPLLYWTAAAWGARISLSKDDPAAVSEVPQMEALIDRALALDPEWNDGAIHALLISYEPSRQGAEGAARERAWRHFQQAVALSGARLAGPFVAFAEAISVQEQNFAEFDALLTQALAIDPDATPAHRLENLLMQRRARWLRAHQEDLFVLPPPGARP